MIITKWGALLSLALLIGVLAAANDVRSWQDWHSRFPLRKQAAFCFGLLGLTYAVWGFLKRGSKILLIDFYCFATPERLKMIRKCLVDAAKAREGGLPEDDVRFHQWLLEQAGIGDTAGYPDCIANHGGLPIVKSIKNCLDETEMVVFNVAQEVMRRACISPSEIGIVMVSCSNFAPTPSIAAMLVNKFKMPSKVLTYNFSGMGDATAVVCVDLAKHMLKALPNTVALIVNHENVTSSWYSGKDRTMIINNCLLRIGGAAILMTNRPCDLGRAKYELLASKRTHLGSEEAAFNCMGCAEDSEGITGTFRKAEVMEVTRNAIKTHVTSFAQEAIPLPELVKFTELENCLPNFSKSFNHVLLHTGGKGIMDKLQADLELSDKQAAPSNKTLFQFGNTAAASTWYTLAQIEGDKGVKKGDRIWQLGYGGSFECNSAVWKARRSIKHKHDCWVGA